MKPSALDRVKRGLAAIIDAQTRRIDLLALYPAKVVSQNADRTLELQPDDARIPPCSKVPIRYGLPGVSAKVSPGARVLLGFAGGDPRAPVATLWESASLLELDIGASPSSYIALATQTKAALDAIVSAFNGHTHVVATTGTAVAQSGTAAAVVTPITASTAVASATVKST